MQWTEKKVSKPPRVILDDVSMDKDPGALTSEDIEVKIVNDPVINNDPDANINETAERFVDLVKNGEPPTKAAKRVGTSLKAINDSLEMKRAVDHLIEVGGLTAEIRKKMIQAGLTKIFMENVLNPEPKNQKVALEAAKLIGQDPEVNIGVEPQVVINLGELSGVKRPSLPGIKGPLDE